MTAYTVEVTMRVPEYVHVEVEAATAAEAREKGLDLARNDWANAKLDYESAGDYLVTGVWEGEAYSGSPLPIVPQGDQDATALARDLGLAIRDFMDDKLLTIYGTNDDTDELVPEGETRVQFVDVSDADNLIVTLSNGQQFTVKIIAGVK